MHKLTLENLLKSGPGRAFPPDAIAGLWSSIREFRRYYHNHHGEQFQHRPDLHGGGGDLQTYTPVPIARELAAFSAALLFGEPPVFTAQRTGAQAALNAFLESNRITELLTVSGEHVAVEGAGGLRASLDDAVPGGVVLDYVSGDRIIWRERFGRFTSGGVLVLERRDGSDVWRLFEDHDVGVVRRRLFKGTLSRLGNPRPLAEGPEHWRALKPETSTGLLDQPTLIRWDNKPGAVSDLAGVLPMLDQYDDAQTLIRQKAAASMPIIAGHESLFDDNAQADLWRGLRFTTQDVVSAGLVSPDKLVQVLQADFDASPMIAYLQHLRAQIVTAAGYSPESWGMDTGPGGRADSGRALALRQTRTSHTRNEKARMATRAISEALGVALALYMGRTLAGPMMPSVELTDTVSAVSEEAAQQQDPTQQEVS